MARAPRGFTILEAMTAMVIVLIAAVGVIGVTNQGVRFNSEGRHLTRAAALAQEFAAQSQIWSYSDPRLLVGPHDGLTDLATGYFGTSNAALAAYGADFTRQWTVTALPDSNANLVQDGIAIVLTVGWSQSGSPRSATFYLTRVNPGDHQ